MFDFSKLITENTFLASDHHFGHANITKFEPLRAQTAELYGYTNHEDMLIEWHNSVVKPDDVVLFLGDFAWKTSQIKLLNV